MQLSTCIIASAAKRTRVRAHGWLTLPKSKGYRQRDEVVLMPQNGGIGLAKESKDSGIMVRAHAGSRRTMHGPSMVPSQSI
eukprot:361217-Chlamydomonas_euryale.AAC.9